MTESKNYWKPFKNYWKQPIMDDSKIMTTRPRNKTNEKINIGDIILPYSWSGRSYYSKWDRWGIELKVIAIFQTSMIINERDLFIQKPWEIISNEGFCELSRFQYAKEEGFIDDENYPDIQKLKNRFLEMYKFKEGIWKEFLSFRFRKLL